MDGEKLSEVGEALTTKFTFMEHHLSSMNKDSLKIGLKILTVKTKFMTNIDTTDNIQIDWTEIENVTDCKYRTVNI